MSTSACVNLMTFPMDHTFSIIIHSFSFSHTLFLSDFLCLSPRIFSLSHFNSNFSTVLLFLAPYLLPQASFTETLTLLQPFLSFRELNACLLPSYLQTVSLASLFSLFEILPQFPHVLVPLISYIASSSFQILTSLYFSPIWGFLSCTIFVSVAPWVYLSHTASVQGGFAGCVNWLST